MNCTIITLLLLLRTVAGVQLERVDGVTKIVGGAQAPQEKYNYFVSWGGDCGATLIAADVVLSAAHCLGTEPKVIVGAYEYESTENHGVQREVVDFRPHPLYNPGTYEFDYVVLKLDRPVEGVKPVVLNDIAELPVMHQDLQVVGFGVTIEGGKGADILNEVAVPYIAPERCNGMYDAVEIFGDIMLCAGASAGGKDACQVSGSNPSCISVTEFGPN